MAGGEIYRVEIPIIVDDQTDKPLQQAEQKISKLEQHARKENERMRQHFMKIGKIQIEPIMRVRDHLTSGVLKADKLIRKLDTTQASPLIAARDRVSAVVTRTNAMLDALDKGKVDVVAEMKGPLLDEIVKAKSALSALNNVKSGPVAELRGELFGQLAKAMSQIRGLGSARAEPQATLRERITMKVKEIGSSLRSLTTQAWNITLQVKDKATSAVKSIAGSVKGIIDKLTSPLALLGAGAGVGAGIIYPLKLAGEFEQAQMSLDFYMGGVEEGKKAFEDLIRFAKETPFEFPFLQGATIQLMGAGYNFEQAKRALTAFGDAAGRTGAGMQGIEAALLGFTQIASAGTLNLQDLRQVALNLKLPLNMFAKELGVAESELGDIGKKAIPSQKAMEAIVRTLEQRFAGGMKELSNSLLGMTAVIKDTANLTVWHFGKGMAGPVKRILMDIIGLTEDTGNAFEEFQRRLEQAGEAVGLKFEQMYEKVKQFFSDLTNTPGFNEMTWSERITLALDKILEGVNDWLSGPGGEMLEKIGETLGILLAAVIKGITPYIVPVAVNLGISIGKGILQGFGEALKSSPLGAIIMGALGGAGLGSVVPVVGTGVGAVLGGFSGLLSWGVQWGLSNFDTSKRYGYVLDITESNSHSNLVADTGAKSGSVISGAGTAAGVYSGTSLASMPKRAIGGIFSKPHMALVAEAGPEAIIPLSARMRPWALELWQQTGELLGVMPELPNNIQQKANISETTRRLTSVIDIEQYRNLKTRNNTINENQMQFITSVNKIQTVKAYATGGILTRPHLGLVAEAGPEAIIPLSVGMRSRALSLWEETGRRLGVRPYAEGGFAGALTQNREQKIPVSSTLSLAMPGPATINLNFDLTGLVRQVVIESREDIDDAVDKIADAIANNLRSVFQNMTK